MTSEAWIKSWLSAATRELYKSRLEGLDNLDKDQQLIRMLAVQMVGALSRVT